MNLNAEIKGWGEDELAEMLGVDVGDDAHEHLEEIRYALETIQVHFMFSEDEENDLGACTWIRAWLHQLATETPSYEGPFFLGIAGVKDNYTMLGLVARSLGHLWT